MTDSGEWEFPVSAQPKPDEVGFDLDGVLSAVVSLQTKIPEDAFTASVLGTERSGHGVLIDSSGLVLTIGYLVMEAETVWLVSGNGMAAAAHVVAVDQVSGFGLVQALGSLGTSAIELGRSGDTGVGEQVIAAGFGGRRRSLNTKVVAKREFAGYWEYLLDEAIFTAPPHPNWGGAALIGRDGRLQGIGSLFVQNAVGSDSSLDGNMFVPIDLLEPIRDDLLKYGRTNQPPRPWLGMYAAEAEDKLVVVGLADDGPADTADLRVGDVVLEVADERVTDLIVLFRKIWALGPAGTQIPLTVWRDGRTLEIAIQSGDRYDYLKAPQTALDRHRADGHRQGPRSASESRSAWRCSGSGCLPRRSGANSIFNQR